VTASSTSSCAPALLSMRELTVKYGPLGEGLPALCNVTVEFRSGEITGILGESGSGKTTLAMAMLGLLPTHAQVTGSLRFHDRELLRLRERDWKQVRGAKIAMIFQEPGLAMSPVMRVGDQIAEVIRAHTSLSRLARRQRVRELLEDVGLPQVDRVFKSYPHQLSGGELSRTAIVQALACEPELLIADEATRSLDVTRRAEILDLFRQANRRTGCAIVFITHDPALLAGFAHRIVVFYRGRVIQDGLTQQVFRQPAHPFTKGLLALVPNSISGKMNPDRRLPEVIDPKSQYADCFNYGN